MTEEELFDAYLDLVLDGEAVDPETFLAERGGGGAVSVTTRERLEAIHAEAQARTLEPLARPADGAGALLAPGSTLGDYELLETLGGGGMGLVFRARQRRLDRDVALKIIRPERLGSATSLQRFRREARGLARLAHPNVVALFDSGVVDGVPYMAMELVPGRGLDDDIASARETGRPLAVADVLDWGGQLADALQAAHEAGLVHRDVKPSNVRIDLDGRARLLDFGIVRDLDSDSLTLTGPFAGSPAYAAPEQIAGGSESIDARTDVYALGVLLYEALTGAVPFPGEGAERVFHRILSEEPLPPRRARSDVPQDLQVVVLKALEKDPRRRYASARALGDDLRAVRELRPIAARPPGALARLHKWSRRQPAAAGGAAAALLAAVVLVAALVAQDRAAEERRAQQVAGALADARTAIDGHESLRGELGQWSWATRNRMNELHARHFLADERVELDAGMERLQQTYTDLSRLVQDGEDAIALAERLGSPDDDALTEEVRLLRADLAATRYRYALDHIVPGPERQSFAERLSRHDLEGRHTELLTPTMTVTLAVTPADAEVYAFRYREQIELPGGGERRLVPIPVGDAPVPVAPGAWALAVRRGAGPVRTGDLVTAVAGAPVEHLLVASRDAGEVARDDVLVDVGRRLVTDLTELETALQDSPGAILLVRRGDEELELSLPPGEQPFTDAARRVEQGDVAVRVARDGELLDLHAPPGLAVRTTAAPLVPHPANRLQPDADGRLVLPSDEILFLIRAPGHEDARAFRSYGSVDEPIAVTLVPEGTTPLGWVHIPRSAAMDGGKEVEEFWIMEREVTAGEYLAFLNDPETLATLDEAAASGRAILFPRSAGNLDEGGLWPWDPEGRFRLPDDWSPDWPVLGVSWDDAMAYSIWRTTRAWAEGRTDVYLLPAAWQWRVAAGTVSTREFPFGNVFRSWWTKSCFSRPQAAPEPVLGFPVDESVFGVFDTAGSVAEWCLDWYDQPAERRHYAGGAWAYSDDGESFRTWSENGGVHDVGYRTVGFRLRMAIPGLREGSGR
jgi:formylglycine-generating enzyme required for sulfatase activity